MICESCIHNAVCKYGEARSNGLYCTGEKCKQYQPTADVVPKSEVAREIFEEIEKIIDKRYNQHIFGCNDLDDEEHEAIINFSDDISGDIDKLKKKYTEGGDQE